MDNNIRSCKYCQKEFPISDFVSKFMCIFCKRSRHRHYINNVYKVKYREKHNKYARNYQKRREKRDPKYKISCDFYREIYNSAIRNRPAGKLMKLLGYTKDDLKEHLKKLFKNDMNWQNYGTYWEIDHIIPISMFNYKDIDDEEFKLCWSLNNLQPLEKEKNKEKGNKFIG